MTMELTNNHGSWSWEQARLVQPITLTGTPENWMWVNWAVISTSMDKDQHWGADCWVKAENTLGLMKSGSWNGTGERT